MKVGGDPRTELLIPDAIKPSGPIGCCRWEGIYQHFPAKSQEFEGWLSFRSALRTGAGGPHWRGMGWWKL